MKGNNDFKTSKKYYQTATIKVAVYDNYDHIA